MVASQDEYSQLSKEEKPPFNPEPETEDGVDVPFEQIPEATLEKLIQEFVMREGTDYGANEVSLPKKIQDIRTQLEKKKLKIVFDLNTETCSIVVK